MQTPTSSCVQPEGAADPSTAAAFPSTALQRLEAEVDRLTEVDKPERKRQLANVIRRSARDWDALLATDTAEAWGAFLDATAAGIDLRHTLDSPEHKAACEPLIRRLRQLTFNRPDDVRRCPHLKRLALRFIPREFDPLPPLPHRQEVPA